MMRYFLNILLVHFPTLCPPCIVINPCFTSSSKAKIEYLLILFMVALISSAEVLKVNTISLSEKINITGLLTFNLISCKLFRDPLFSNWYLKFIENKFINSYKLLIILNLLPINYIFLFFF